jgi:Tol biopolymer transport system component
MNADGSNQVRITNDSSNDWAPSFSPDGTKIAFVTDRAGAPGPGVYVMDADGSNQQDLSNSPDTTDFAPAFSTDGSRIAFASDRGGSPEVYIMNADGSSVQFINHNGASDISPAWCLTP